MTYLKSPTLNPDTSDPARAMVDVWCEAMTVLETERLQRLRGLSELEAARQFAGLLQLPSPYPLRPSSGLVEQQRLLAALRTHA